jgi:hypothetical protein
MGNCPGLLDSGDCGPDHEIYDNSWLSGGANG